MAFETAQTSTSTKSDVLVIGAGLSGLQAAVKIHDAGFSCLVLEATDRVGGKTVSIKSSSKPAGINDLGAMWLNDSNQSEIWKLFEKYNIGTVVQRATGTSFRQSEDGSTVAHPYRRESSVSTYLSMRKSDKYSIANIEPILKEEGDRVAELQQVFGAILEAIEASDLEHPESGDQAQRLDKMTFAEFCQEAGPNVGAGVASVATASLLGVEAEEVSALFMINYVKSGYGIRVISSDQKDGAQYIRARRGEQRHHSTLLSEADIITSPCHRHANYIRRPRQRTSSRIPLLEYGGEVRPPDTGRVLRSKIYNRDCIRGQAYRSVYPD